VLVRRQPAHLITCQRRTFFFCAQQASKFEAQNKHSHIASMTRLAFIASRGAASLATFSAAALSSSEKQGWPQAGPVPTDARGLVVRGPGGELLAVRATVNYQVTTHVARERKLLGEELPSFSNANMNIYVSLPTTTCSIS
jgi:hypothetical protein